MDHFPLSSRNGIVAWFRCHSVDRRNPVIKKLKYVKPLALKAQFISLFSGSRGQATG
ncbi:hypothetical protein RBEAN4_0903 [Rickettsia bellii str. RML An4]|uniref:Uncharacterized protein n=1 Tax=Rickettsia bellii str. RML An4 TaxID=1359193 RepID=A0A0F3QCB2_RICBE|nr:hypothetical protein A1I_02385 [Rickettsia bellii OSU 85-389]KJV89912.1 hypothetical protein RBEAN4_0903 [Rickettsia bellii str. RML An4]